MILVGLFRLRVQNKKLYLATFAAVLGPLSVGFALGYSSPVIPELRKISDPKLRMDSNQASWFGVSLCVYMLLDGVLINELMFILIFKTPAYSCTFFWKLLFTFQDLKRNCCLLFIYIYVK